MLHVHSLTVALQLWESFTLCGSYFMWFVATNRRYNVL